MCIICVKPVGTLPPNEETIRRMFKNNSDGAGFMYNHDGKVVIQKGYMNVNKLLKKLGKLYSRIDVQNSAIVYHFRITTSGGSTPENTHPFPVSSKLEDLKKTYMECDLGVVHNGMIDITNPKDISDTMTYIKNELSLLYKHDKRFYDDDSLCNMIYNRITSKLAILNGDGEVSTIGTFTENEGLFYSNETYADTYINYYSYGWDDDDFTGRYGKYSWYDEHKKWKERKNPVKAVRAGNQDVWWCDDDTGKWVNLGILDDANFNALSESPSEDDDDMPFDTEAPKTSLLVDATRRPIMALWGDKVDAVMGVVMDGEKLDEVMDLIHLGMCMGECGVDKDMNFYEYDDYYLTWTPTYEKVQSLFIDGVQVKYNPYEADEVTVW